MQELSNTGERYEVLLKTTLLTFELQQFRSVVISWARDWYCQLEEDMKTVSLTLGRTNQIGILLKGKKTKNLISFYTGKILASLLNESEVMGLLQQMSNLQTNGTGIFGVLIIRNQQFPRPLVIHNGEIFDEGKMMDLLWNHYSTTRVREARKIADMYYFLRDVPKG